MRSLIYASCLMTAFAATGPDWAQQDANSPNIAQHAARISKADQPQPSGQGGYTGYCGDYFRCYTGIPLHCGDNTRPYQNIAKHACFCVHDGCPQQ